MNARVLSALHAIMPNLSLEAITLGKRTLLPADDRDREPVKGCDLLRRISRGWSGRRS